MVETHMIDGVSVKVFSAVRTVADCFRHRRTVGLAVALEGRQEALRQRKATPAALMRLAEAGGVAPVMRPYLEAMKAASSTPAATRRTTAPSPRRVRGIATTSASSSPPRTAPKSPT
jgi:hypothetical protein